MSYSGWLWGRPLRVCCYWGFGIDGGRGGDWGEVDRLKGINCSRRVCGCRWPRLIFDRDRGCRDTTRLYARGKGSYRGFCSALRRASDPGDGIPMSPFCLASDPVKEY